MKKVELGSLCTRIRYGPHRKTQLQGNAKYLKGQHFSPQGTPINFEGSFLQLQDVELEKYGLTADQVIVLAKGNRTFAWAYASDFGPTVASSSFFVLTLDTGRILPAYCSLVLNTAPCVRALERMAKGTNIPVLPKKELLALTIPLPGLQRQRQLVKLRALQLRRAALQREIIAQQDSVDQAILTQLTHHD